MYACVCTCPSNDVCLYLSNKDMNVCMFPAQVGGEGIAHDEVVLRQPAALHPGDPRAQTQVCTVS